MRYLKNLLFAVLCSAMVMSVTSCSKDDEPGDEPGGSMSGEGNYGQLGSNMIVTGGIRDLSYTRVVLLGTVDFSKLSDTHTYGIVYMEQRAEENFDYNLNLTYGSRYQVKYATIYSANDGRFEKQLIDLKPGTTYYYRAYLTIGSNYNYSEVKSFTTLDPLKPQNSSEGISMFTSEATDLKAFCATLKGRVKLGEINNGLPQEEIRHQAYGFIISDALNTPETLTQEYWDTWYDTHFDTQERPDQPTILTTNENINTLIQTVATNLTPGTKYYYRSVFIWNGKYFYSPEVQSFSTLGLNEITVGTLVPDDITSNSATLKGHVPFEKIGLDMVRGGFMISTKYTNKSEFVMDDNMQPWPSSDLISYVSTSVSDVDFTASISRLEAGTEYHICAFIELGRDKDGKTIYQYGDVRSFTTEGNPAPNPGGNDNPGNGNSDDLSVFGVGDYPWREYSEDSYMSANAGVHSSTSTLVIQVPSSMSGTLSFGYYVDSESSYDVMEVRKCSGLTTDANSGSVEFRESGLAKSGIFLTSVSGPCTIIVNYKKDGSSSSGQDNARIYNISLR